MNVNFWTGKTNKKYRAKKVSQENTAWIFKESPSGLARAGFHMEVGHP